MNTSRIGEMPKINKFEDIIAWQKANKLVLEVYKSFPTLKDYGFKDQIQRASVSIMSNVAEGYEKGSKKDFIRYLYIAKGSCGETRSLIILAKQLNYLTDEKYNYLYKECGSVSRLISGLIKSTRTIFDIKIKNC